MNKSYLKGLKDGIPIGIGYFAVSFSFGILASKYHISAVSATIMSLTNVTSAGQFAGLTAFAAGEGLIELILIQIIINLRYALMGFSLGQKLPTDISTLQRAIIAFSNTDEIFAVAISVKHPLSFKYMLGLSSFPVFGWTLGTLVGALAGQILPANITNALGIALYAMLTAIVMPNVKEQKSVRIVVIISLILSCMFAYIPFINKISSGISIVICTVIASTVGAVFFPVKEGEPK